MLDEQKFKKLADDALNLLNRELIAASRGSGFEVDFNSGALGVEFEDPPAKLVISPNTPVCQIWGAANNTSSKIDRAGVENAFVPSESGDSLKILVEKTISKQMGEEINL